MNPLNLIPAPYRALAAGLAIIAAALAVFIAGWNVGADHVQAKWDAETKAEDKAVVTQAVDVAQKANKSGEVNREVSNYVQSRVAAVTAYYGGLRLPTQSSDGSLPSVPAGAAGVAATAQSHLPAQQCSQLIEDAAYDAVILQAWAKWYQEQSAIFKARSAELSDSPQ